MVCSGDIIAGDICPGADWQSDVQMQIMLSGGRESQFHIDLNAGDGESAHSRNEIHGVV